MKTTSCRRIVRTAIYAADGISRFIFSVLGANRHYTQKCRVVGCLKADVNPQQESSQSKFGRDRFGNCFNVWSKWSSSQCPRRLGGFPKPVRKAKSVLFFRYQQAFTGRRKSLSHEEIVGWAYGMVPSTSEASFIVIDSSRRQHSRVKLKAYLHAKKGLPETSAVFLNS
eukprot:scaffold7395_cov175-Amphora_coffeaeformis.AAC.7